MDDNTPQVQPVQTPVPQNNIPDEIVNELPMNNNSFEDVVGPVTAAQGAVSAPVNPAPGSDTSMPGSGVPAHSSGVPPQTTAPFSATASVSNPAPLTEPAVQSVDNQQAVSSFAQNLSAQPAPQAPVEPISPAVDEPPAPAKKRGLGVATNLMNSLPFTKSNDSKLPGEASPTDSTGIAAAQPSAFGAPQPIDTPASEAPADTASTDPLTAPITATNTDIDSQQADLLDVKKGALQELSPLIEHIDQEPEERYKTLLDMIRASDDVTLVRPAYAAAQGISDDKARAKALLEIVKEVNYLTQPDSDSKTSPGPS